MPQTVGYSKMWSITVHYLTSAKTVIVIIVRSTESRHNVLIVQAVLMA